MITPTARSITLPLKAKPELVEDRAGFPDGLDILQIHGFSRGGRSRQFSPSSLAPAGGRAGGVLGLDGELGEVDVVAWMLALGGLEAVLELGDALLQQGDAGLGLVGAAGAGDLGVAELALEGGEQVERVAAPVGAGDLALLLAEEGRGTWARSRGCAGGAR